MKTLILDGSPKGDPMAAKIRLALLEKLPDSETITLHEHRIGNCVGDFLCWVQNPGVCNTNDDNRMIAAKIVQSDLLVYLTPLTFGGYSAELKRIVDHQIQNILPYFATIRGETHHKKRYRTYPHMLAISWTAEPDPRDEELFRGLVQRNAINMHARRSYAIVVGGDPSQTELTNRAGEWLQALENAGSSMAEVPPAALGEVTHSKPPRRAVLLVGSPRTRKSSSAALGSYLMQQLEGQGVETETIQIYTSFNSPSRTARALEKLDAADLVVLSFPLYVDNLPAPVLAALETIAQHRAEGLQGGRLAAIANCGFPEAAHNNTALSICVQFARQSGYAWAGGLSLGGGGGIVQGKPLEESGNRTATIRQSLEMAAGALAVGESIPSASIDLMARPLIPIWLYLLVGGFGWNMQAREYGVRDRIKARPYV